MNTAVLAELMIPPSIEFDVENLAGLKKLAENPFLDWENSITEKIQSRLENIVEGAKIDAETDQMIVSYFREHLEIGNLMVLVKKTLKDTYFLLNKTRYGLKPDVLYERLLKVYSLHLDAIGSIQSDLDISKYVTEKPEFQNEAFDKFLRNSLVIQSHLHSYASDIARDLYSMPYGPRELQLEFAFRWYAHAHMSEDSQIELDDTPTLYKANRIRERARAAYAIHHFLIRFSLNNPVDEWEHEVSEKDWYNVVAQGCYQKALDMADKILKYPLTKEDRMKVAIFRQKTDEEAFRV